MKDSKESKNCRSGNGGEGEESKWDSSSSVNSDSKLERICEREPNFMEKERNFGHSFFFLIKLYF